MEVRILLLMLNFYNVETIKTNTKNQKVFCVPINELFICQCQNTEHQLIFSYFPDDNENEVYVSMHLIPDNFWKRLVNTVKYLFGHKSKYGDFDEFIFNNQDADKLQSIVNYLRS